VSAKANYETEPGVDDEVVYDAYDEALPEIETPAAWTRCEPAAVGHVSLDRRLGGSGSALGVRQPHPQRTSNGGSRSATFQC
jgi:hypothetical protein